MITTSETCAFIGPLGPAETGIILFIIVLLFGAKKLPQLARSMGKSMGEFKRGKKEFEDELKRASDTPEETPSGKQAGPSGEKDSQA